MNRMMVQFAAVMAIAVIGMDYGLAWKAHAGTSYSALDHVRARIAGLSVPGSGIAANPKELAEVLPPAPAGFSTRVGRDMDTFLVMGRDATPQEREAVDRMNALFRDAIPGYQAARQFYQNGDRMAYVEVDFVPHDQRDSRGVQFADGLQAQLVATGTMVPAFKLGETQVYKMTDASLGAAEVYGAKFDPQGYVSVASSLGQDVTEALLKSVNYTAFLALVKNDPTRDPARKEAETTAADADGAAADTVGTAVAGLAAKTAGAARAVKPGFAGNSAKTEIAAQTAAPQEGVICVRKAGKRVCSPAK